MQWIVQTRLLRSIGHPEVIHFIGTARRPASGLFQAVRLATNLPLFLRCLQLPVLVTARSVRVRLSRTIQGPKSQPESCFGRLCLSPENPKSEKWRLVPKLPARTNRELMQESTAGTWFTIRLDKAFMKSSGRARADDARNRSCTQKPVIS